MSEQSAFSETDQIEDSQVKGRRYEETMERLILLDSGYIRTTTRLTEFENTKESESDLISDSKTKSTIVKNGIFAGSFLGLMALLLIVL